MKRSSTAEGTLEQIMGGTWGNTHVAIVLLLTYHIPFNPWMVPSWRLLPRCLGSRGFALSLTDYG